MALPNPWELNSDSDTTMIPFDQLKAQGMKYTPEQMAAFDRGRGRILASEVNEAQSNPGLESPPQSEIAHLNPTAYNSFSDRVSNPTTTDSGDTGPKPWDLPQEKTSFDKVAEKYPTLAKGIKATANALDVIPGSPGSEMMTALNRGVDIGKSLSNNGVLASIGKGARYAGDFALGAGEGISQGVGQGAAALLQTLSLDPRSNTDLAQERQTVGSLKSLLPKAFQDEIEHSLGSQDAQHLLSLPWEMSGDFVVNQLKQAGHTDLAGSVEQLLLAGAMLMGGKGKKGAKEVAAEEDKPASNPNATAVDDILGESGTSATGEAPPMFTIKGKKIADEGHGYATNVTPEEMTSEFDSRQGGFNFDPLERGESGDMLGPNIRGTQDVTTGLSPDEMYARRPIDSPAQGDLDLTNNPTPKADIAKQTIADLEKGKGLRSTTNGPDVPYQAMADLPEQGDVFDAANQSAWERYKARVAARQNATRYDNVGGTYQEPIVPPIVEGGSGKPLGQARRYGKQGGAVNMGFADEVAKRIENLKKGLQNISRDRESFGVGDTVRLMNGKTGSITGIKDGRYQIKGKDFMDSVPVQGIDYKYKPAGMVNSSVGYPKAQPHPLGGVGKRQGGAIDLSRDTRERDLNPNDSPNDGKFGQGGAIKLGAFWSKKPKATTSDSSLEPHQAKDVPVPLSKEAQVDIIYRMYARARNPEDFKNNLRLVNKRNSNFPIDAVNRSNELWTKFESGYRPEKSIYSQMDSMNKRDVIALRPIEQAMKEIKVGDKPLDKVKLKDGDDLGYISKEFSSPMHIITLNWGKPVAELFANVHGELTDMTAMWNDRLGEWMNNNKPYIKLDRKSQIAVDRAEEFWDNHQVLTDRGLMWPTKEMLMDKNYTKLTEAEAEAYLKHADGYVDAYKAAGIERPPIPGYMPHVWKGSYRVNITGPKGLVGVQRTTFRWQANKIAKDMEKKGYHAEVVDPQVSNKGDYIRVMEETLLQAQKYGKLGANVAKKIEGELYGSLEGTITESLERRGIAGFVRNELSPNFNVLHPLDSINKGIKTRINNNIRSGLFEQSMNDFARAGRNAQIIESVAKPFYQNIGNMRQAKNLIDSVSDMISVATGMRRLEVSAPDRWGKRMLIKMGLPPNGIRDFVQAANAYARIQRINSFNLGFTAEHLYFGLPGLLDLRRMDLDRAAAGEKTGSYLKAIGTFGKDFVTFGQFRSPEGMRVEKWARDNGVYGSHYYDEPAFKSTTGKVVGAMTHGALMLVVNRMKSVNFHMAYRYFKDVMPENEALQAAKQHVKKTMQSFEPLDRPEVFNEGTAGLAVRTFNQIKLYNLSRIGEMLKSIGDSVKQGSYGAAAGHMVNLIGLAGLFTALGGAAGIPFHDDWEFIRKWGQEHLPTWNLGGQSVWQSYEELMSRAGIPNFIIMGMFPKLTGMDTRHTFEINLSNVFSGAGVEAVGAFTELALSRLGALITGKENPADIYKAKTKLLPTTAVPWIQDEAAKHLNGNIPNNRLEPTTPRTEEEDLIYKITSKKAISESQRNEFQSILKDIDARNTKIREAYLDLIVKKMSGFDTGRKDVNELIDDALHMNIGFDAQHLNEEIIKKIKEEHLSSAIKYIEEAAKGNNQNLKATRFRNMQMLLQGGQLGR